jgi:hypothetical protein
VRFLQILEGKDAKTAVVIAVTRDRSVIDAAAKALSERLQGGIPLRSVSVRDADLATDATRNGPRNR